MPELPEVETIARILRPDLIGRTIVEARGAVAADHRVRLPCGHSSARSAGRSSRESRGAQSSCTSSYRALTSSFTCA